MFLLNSRLGLFTAAYSRRHPFSRSYGVILPSSLTMVLSLTLEFSSQLPVSVCGTGTSYLDSGFSWEFGFIDFATKFRSPSHFSLTSSGFAYYSTFVLRRPIPSGRSISLLCPHFSQSIFGGTGISTCCPSASPFGFTLGPDLPRADEPSSGNLSLSVDRILTYLSLLTPAFSLLTSPPRLTARLLRC